MTPDIQSLYETIDRTWPAASKVDVGPWCLREGRGGGKRVSAATAEADPDAGDITSAEAAMRLMGQTPLFMIRNTDQALDALLAEQGYDIVDPVNVWVCPVDLLCDVPLPLFRF